MVKTPLHFDSPPENESGMKRSKIVSKKKVTSMETNCFLEGGGG
jgi:hypothetical protein